MVVSGGCRRVVVTGSCGFIGTHVTDRLRRAHATVVEVDLRHPRHAVDVRQPLDVTAWEGAEAVVHLAAIAGVAPSLQRPVPYYTTNVVGTAQVLEAAVAARVRRVVVASSSSVFGHCAVPAVDDRAHAPLSPYAHSKAMVEALTRQYADRLELVLVRPFTVYGPGQRPDMLIGQLLRGQFGGGRRLRLWDFRRDFTYVDDLAAALVSACTAPMPSRWEAFNLGSGRPVGARDLLAALAEVTGRTPLVEWGAQRPGEPATTWADPAKAMRLLDFAPSTALPDGLRAQATTAIALAS